MKNCLLYLLLTIFVMGIITNVSGHHPINPPADPPPKKPDKPPLDLPNDFLIYDVIYNLIPPREKPKVEAGTGTVATDLFNTLLPGMEFLDAYVTHFDTFLITDWNKMLRGFPWMVEVEKFFPALNTYLRRLLLLNFAYLVTSPDALFGSYPEGHEIEYLIHIGQPTLVGVQAVNKFVPPPKKPPRKGKGLLVHRVTQSVEKAIGPPPSQPPPKPSEGKTPFETMVHRLIKEELGENYYHHTYLGFGQRLRALGEKALPYIIEAAKNDKYLLIRRNAVSLLEAYEPQLVLETLRGLLKDPDPVVRNRALSILINKRDTEIVPYLIEALNTSKDNYFKTYLAYALGELRDKRAVKPILDYINSDPNNLDILWVALPALGKIGDDSPEVKDLLQKMAEKKIALTKTLALLSLYALGDDTALEKLGLRPEGAPLRKIHTAASFFVLKALRARGEKANPILLAIANERAYDVRLRVAAMAHIRFTEKLKEEVRNFIKDAPKLDTPPLLVGCALYGLFMMKDREITQYAQLVIDQSLPQLIKKTKKNRRLEGEGFDIVIALNVLGIFKQNKVSVLKDIISAEYERHLEIKKIEEKLPKEQTEQEIKFMVPLAPVMETAITQLGKIGSQEAVEVLTNCLNLKDFPQRAEIALTLGGMTEGKLAIEPLIKLLSDDDGWTRFCAYQSLNQLTGKDFNCEWVFDPPQARNKIVKEWEKWWSEEKKKNK